MTKHRVVIRLSRAVKVTANIYRLIEEACNNAGKSYDDTLVIASVSPIQTDAVYGVATPKVGVLARGEVIAFSIDDAIAEIDCVTGTIVLREFRPAQGEFLVMDVVLG